MVIGFAILISAYENLIPWFLFSLQNKHANLLSKTK
jgi:hypothetical protein